jgi:hypothetical protein
MADSRMNFILSGEDRLSRVFDNAGRSADRLAKTLLKAGAIGGAAPFGAAVVTGVGAMTAAFASAGIAAGAFYAAVQPQIKLMQENAEAAQKVADAQEDAANKQQVADRLSAEGSELAEKAQKSATTAKLAAVQAENAYTRATKGTPKATADAALALAKLKSAHESWSASLAGDTMPLFTRGIDAARKSLPLLTPLVKTTSRALTDFANSGDKSGGFKRFLGRVNEAAKDVLPALLNSGRNVFRGLGGIIDAFLPSSDNFAGGLERGTAAFARWGQGLRNSDGFRRFVDTASAGAGALGNLALAAGGLLSDLSPLLGVTTSLATGFAQIIGWLPPETLEFIAGALLGIKLATLGWAGAQALLNLAMAANPVGLIIMGLVLLGAALVTAWQKSQTFREIVTIAFTGLSSPVLGFASMVLQAQREVALSFLDFAELLLGVGERAFSWIPGVGDKLATAREAVDGFKGTVETGFDIAIDKVDGWKEAVDRMPLEVTLKGNIKDLEEKIDKAKEQLSDKNLPPGKKAKLTADITKWNQGLVDAKVKLERTPAKKEAKLTGDIRNWSSKIDEATRKLKTAPDSKKARLLADIADLTSKVKLAKQALAGVKSKTVTITTKYVVVGDGSAARKQGSHGSQLRAGGGLITGPGTGTSDDVPIWASNGEFMIRKASVDKYGLDFLRAVNSGTLGSSQVPSATATVAPRPAVARGGTVVHNTFVINDALDPVAVAKQIQKILLKLKRMGGGNIDLGLGGP